jgi:hypothetical protein
MLLNFTVMGVWQGMAIDSLKFHPSMPCEQATPETDSWTFQGWSVRRVGGLHPSSTPLEFRHPTPYAYDCYRHQLTLAHSAMPPLRSRRNVKDKAA